MVLDQDRFLIERTRANPKSCYRARNRIKKRERGAPSVVVLFRDQQYLSIEEGWSVDGRGDMSSPSYSVTIGRRRRRRRLRSTLLLREDRGRRMEREEILLCPIVDLLSPLYSIWSTTSSVFNRKEDHLIFSTRIALSYIKSWFSRGFILWGPMPTKYISISVKVRYYDKIINVVK